MKCVLSKMHTKRIHIHRAVGRGLGMLGTRSPRKEVSHSHAQSHLHRYVTPALSHKLFKCSVQSKTWEEETCAWEV